VAIAKDKKRYILELVSRPQYVTKVEGFLLKATRSLGLDEDQFNRLLIATTEAVNNSIIHGNRRNPKKKVVLVCEIGSTSIIIHVQDEGPGINPDKLPDPLSAENLLRENGRGVFLIRSLMSNVRFKKLKVGAEVVMSMKVS
jgi:serine/threonine-protein kinase RsbW